MRERTTRIRHAGFRERLAARRLTGEPLARLRPELARPAAPEHRRDRSTLSASGHPEENPATTRSTPETLERLAAAEVLFADTRCRIAAATYALGGRVRLDLVETPGGRHVAHVTRNLPGVALAPGEVIVKDAGENAGVLSALTDAGVIEQTGEVLKTPFGPLVVCRLLAASATNPAHRGRAA